MTAVWCLKMGIGLNEANTKPGLAESTIAQFDYDGNNKNAGAVALKFLPKARLVLYDGGAWNETGSNSCKNVIQQPQNTFFFWGYPGHAIGTAKRDGYYYLFDPDKGLDKFSSVKEFQQHVLDTYAAHINKSWWLFSVKPDPAEKGISYAINQ